MDNELASTASDTYLTRRISQHTQNAALSDYEVDRAALATVGKKQVLKVLSANAV
jgi:hypothetical protein